MDTDFLDSGLFHEQGIPEVDSSMLALDDCLDVLGNMAEGVCKTDAERLEYLSLWDTDDYPTASFTARRSSVNEEVVMLGLLSGIANVIATVTKAIYRIIATLIRAITFPFRWMLGMTGDGSSGDGSGGSGGGGGHLGGSAKEIIKNVGPAAQRIATTAAHLDKAFEETKIKPETVDDRVHAEIHRLGKQVIDRNGIGTIVSFNAAIKRAAQSLPPGIHEALINDNKILAGMGLTTGAVDIHEIQRQMVQLADVKDELSLWVGSVLASDPFPLLFNNVSGSIRKGDRAWTEFNGTREDVWKLVYAINESPMDSNPKGHLSQKLIQRTRGATIGNLARAGTGNRLPFVDRYLQAISRVPIEDYRTSEGLLRTAYEEYSKDPFWEEVRKETERFMIPPEDPTERQKTGEKALEELDLFHYLSDPKYADNANNMWSLLDSFHARQANFESKGLKNEVPSQLGSLQTTYSVSAMLGPNRPLGLAYSTVTGKIRRSYNLDDPRYESAFNKVISGGNAHAPVDTPETAFIVSTLQDVIRVCNKNHWVNEASAVNQIVALMKDNMNALIQFLRMVDFTRTNWTALMISAWVGLNNWMANVQEMYLSLFAYGYVIEADPEYAFEALSAAIGRKLTDEEKQLVVHDVANSSVTNPVLPANAMTIFASMDKDGETVPAAIEFMEKFDQMTRKGQAKVYDTFGKYMDIQRKGRFDISPDESSRNIRNILYANEMNGKLKRSGRKLKNSPAYAPFRKENAKIIKLTPELQRFVTGMSRDFPHIGKGLDDVVRKAHGIVDHQYKLRMAIHSIQRHMHDGPDGPDKDKEEQQLRIMTAELEESLRHGGQVSPRRS